MNEDQVTMWKPAMHPGDAIARVVGCWDDSRSLLLAGDKEWPAYLLYATYEEARTQSIRLRNVMLRQAKEIIRFYENKVKSLVSMAFPDQEPQP